VGVVIRSTGSQYRVRLPNGQVLVATLRGKLRQDELDSTNPVAVGDRVRLDVAGEAPVVAEILPRDNYMLRRSTHNEHHRQILCANIDQAVFVFTVEYPFTALGSLDRFLVMAEAYHIPVTIVFTKVDLLKSKEKLWAKLADYRAIYEDAGYPHLALNATNPDNAEKVRNLLQGKVTFLAGASGAGKSTLVNLADPHLQLRTQPLARGSNKGQHTTTFAEMHPLSMGGYVVDAPGFREFDVFGIEPEELSHYYPEMRALLPQCRYNNCLHVNEPDCAVLAAVRSYDLPESRYNTYLNILESVSKKAW
jgi:ribosome biogenesis GTPase